MFKRYLVGFFKDEDNLLAAVRAVRSKGFSITDVYSPYAIHGIDEAMGIKRSRLAWVTLIAAFVGLALALFFQFWTSAINWPVNVGGKPHNSTLAYIPVAFEITILFGGLTTVAAFFLKERLFHGSKPKAHFEGVTSDTFALVLDYRDAAFDEVAAKKILKDSRASKVESKVVHS